MTFLTASGYSEGKIKACHSVLVELVHILGDFVDDMAIAGGWVPTLLIPNAREEHIGSMDVDLVLNGANISDEAYATIGKILERHGYRQNDDPGAQFRYFKDVRLDGGTYAVELDLLTGEYWGETGRNRRHEPIQDVKARKARGTDLVFARTETVTVTGELPGNAGQDTVQCKIAGVVPFIVMKGIVIGKRIKEKDAYDLDFVLRNYPGSVETIADLMKVDVGNGLVQEALSTMAQKFATVDHWGPRAVVQFLEMDDGDDRAIRQRAAYETVQAFLDALGVNKA